MLKPHPQKAQSPAATGQSADETNQHNPIVAQPVDMGKPVANLIAQYAMRGHIVHRLADGGFLVVKHGMCRECKDLQALEAFARQTGVVQ